MLVACEHKVDSKTSSNAQDQEEKYLSSAFENLNSQKKPDSIQIALLKKLEERIDKLSNDILKNKYQLVLSYNYLELGDSIKFRESNQKARKLAEKLKDSAAIAASFWDLGDFYQSRNLKDSAYYYYNNAQKMYDALNEDYSAARILLNMAIIQKNIKDYTGSEITTTKAISLLKPLEKSNQLYSAYNNLGIVFNELEDYQRSLAYYKQAELYLNQENQIDRFPSLWNNIGIVYHNKGNYIKAHEYYQKALNFRDSIVKNNPELYAMLLDNYSYNRFKAKDTTNVLTTLKYALNIRESHNLVAGEIINKIHLAEYYIRKKDTTIAISYLEDAKSQSIRSQNTRDILTSLKLLSELSKKHSSEYASEYIRLSDSLYKEERDTRNKFARIRFETDEYISRSEKLNEKITQLSLIAVTSLFIISLIYIIFFVKSRNKELRLIKQRQRANIEIYNLTLAQKRNFEEGKDREKHRMSRELHDGVLGKLFGIYLSLDALNDESKKEAVKRRKRYIQELKTISDEIRSISQELSLSQTYDVNFQTLICEYIDQVKENNSQVFFDLSIDNDIPWEDIADEIKMNFYKILQEGLHNIQKHARASKVSIYFNLCGKNLKLSIKDNGIGFNKKNFTGIGLKNMRSRAKSIGANLSIQSSKEGTIISLQLQI